MCATVLIINQEGLANYNVKMVLQHSLEVPNVDLANTVEHAFLQFKDQPRKKCCAQAYQLIICDEKAKKDSKLIKQLQRQN